MRFYVLFALVTLAGFSFAAMAGSLSVAAVWPAINGRVEMLSARRRALWLFTLRILPTTSGAACALILSITFLAYEPRDTKEAVGGVLALLAGAGAALLGLAVARSLRLIVSGTALSRLTRHCHQWTSRDGAAAAVVESGYPVAAVAGVFRPRLMLSARVLRECTDGEIAAIVAHERAHVRRGDNLARAVLRALPDGWLAPATAGEIETAWTRAAEEAADEDAAGRSGSQRAAFAATLVRVAQMAEEAPPAWMPELAFYEGHDLERRVRALLDDPRRDRRRVALVETATIALALSAVAWSISSMAALHAAMEWGVQLLP